MITGGSKGLGRAIAEEFVQLGANVAICARDKGEIESVGAALRDSGRKVYAAVADVTDPTQIEQFVKNAAEHLSGVNVLVNNAGRAHPGDFSSLTDQDWRADLDVKLFAMIRCSREVLPYMRTGGSGRIININAVYGKYPDPTFFATSVNRAACMAFSKALAMQLGPANILVNSVNIGFVRTPQWGAIHKLRAADQSQEEFFEAIAASEVPLGRFGTPDEVSGLVAFLASDRASYITGASIDVGGGMGRYW